MCRTDAQMVDGYFEAYHPLTFPITPGHEIAGTVEKIGSLVPKTASLTEGDQVVVIGGWGDGTCRLCQAGNTQICGHGNWPGFGPPGGYGEFVPSRYDYLIRIDKKYNLKAEQLAPLTDAGLTPYRGIKKLRDAGTLGPDRVMAFIASAVWELTRFSMRSCFRPARASWRSAGMTTNWQSQRSTAQIT